MNPPQGSSYIILPKCESYERREGQWVKKNIEETTRRSVNEVLKSPTTPASQNGCIHEWGPHPHAGPIPTIAFIPPRHLYQCILCNKQTSSIVKIPLVSPNKDKSRCKHEFASDTTLGFKYKKYQACQKCGKNKKIKEND